MPAAAPTVQDARPVASSSAPTSRVVAERAPVIVDTVWLHANLGRVRVIDTRPTRDFLDGHIPGACSFPLDALLVEDSRSGALTRLARAAQSALAARGIAPDDHIVLVDDADGSAALGATVCELAGSRATSVVHGGMGEWARAGHEADCMPTMHAATAAEAWLDTAPHLAAVASFEDLRDAVELERAIVLDVRSQLEHEGIIGAQCCTSRGAIPYSVHLEWTALFDMSGAPRSAERIRAIAEHVGLSPKAPIIVTCHAGHRAAIAARLLRHAGFDGVRSSLGSWHEWSLRSATLRPASQGGL